MKLFFASFLAVSLNHGPKEIDFDLHKLSILSMPRILTMNKQRFKARTICEKKKKRLHANEQTQLSLPRSFVYVHIVPQPPLQNDNAPASLLSNSTFL